MLGLQEEGEYAKPFLWDTRTLDVDDSIGAELEGDVTPLDWSSDAEALLVARYWGGEEQLHLYSIEDRQMRSIGHKPGSFSFTGRGGSYLKNDRVFVTYQNFAQNSKVVSIDGSTGSMRDELALGEHIEAVNCESVTFLSSDGTPVQAWLSVPRGPGPHPLIISMHGGPHMVAKSAFSPGALSFLDCGFAHMSLNYRGSITFGKDFRAKIVGNIGKWESEDVVAGRKWAINEGIAAQDKVLLVGSSYGGYLVLYCLAKHPDLWQGGVARNAIADWMMKYEDEMTSMKGITASMFAGVPEDKPDVYTCSSPLSCADQIEAPILVFQSRRDSRVPPRQMRAFEDRMRKLRKPFEIHWLDSGHLGSQGDVEESIRQQEMILNFCLDVIGDSASVV